MTTRNDGKLKNNPHPFHAMKTKRIPSVESLETIPGPELIRRIRRAKDLDSTVADKLIAAGRGDELISETHTKTDPLSVESRQINDTLFALRWERQRRNEYHGTDKPIKRRAV